MGNLGTTIIKFRIPFGIPNAAADCCLYVLTLPWWYDVTWEVTTTNSKNGNEIQLVPPTSEGAIEAGGKKLEVSISFFTIPVDYPHDS